MVGGSSGAAAMRTIFPRLQTLARRAIIARRLGFHFTGTSRFRPPTSVILSGERRTLSFPDDQMLAFDVIDLWLDDEYGLSKIARPIRTVLDIGANVGLFSLWARSHFPKARIHSYEPNPALQTHLVTNLRYLSDVTIWAEGVSDGPGFARLDVRGSSLLARTTADAAGEVTLVSLRTALDRIGGHVDLMKLDCEGAEWVIFHDPEPFVTVREIRMEYHLTEGRSLDDLREAVHRIDFDITHLRAHQGFGIACLSNRRPCDPAATKSYAIS
jgi:FkbM family methyltransferase